MIDPGKWKEPDQENLEWLTMHALFAADHEFAQPGPPSRIPNPDGSVQPETSHERLRRSVRAGLRLLLANGMVNPVSQEERPTWICLEAPREQP